MVLSDTSEQRINLGASGMWGGRWPKRTGVALTAVFLIILALAPLDAAGWGSLASHDYKLDVKIPDNAPRVGYAIVTTKATVAGSKELSRYIEHLKERGFAVYLVTEDDYGYAEGQRRAVNIRNWLKSHYILFNIKYVLLIGNPDPDDPSDPNDTYGDVPMIMAWPRVRYVDPATNGTIVYNSTPTDYFYADLSGNWDLDGDGYYGEYPDDFGEGGVDLSPEVFVGRIPVYNDNYTALDSILKRLMAFDGAPKRILLPMAVIDYAKENGGPVEEMTDGRRLPYYVGQIAEPLGFNVTAMYEGASLSPVPKSAAYYDYDTTEENFVREWNKGYGIVLWLAHGSRRAAYRKVWASDDGDGIPEDSEMRIYPLVDLSTVSRLKPEPTFVFQGSCLNGYPEDSENLQYALLKSVAIATVGSTRESWYAMGTWEPKMIPNDFTLGYVYVRNLLEGMSAGEALYVGKASFYVSDPLWVMNLYNFNLYGDPSLGLNGVVYPKTRRKVLYVDDDRRDFPGADYTNITAALKAIDENGVILVYPGRYNESLTIDVPGVRVISVVLGKAVVGNGKSGVHVTVGDVTVEGLSLRGDLVVGGRSLVITHIAIRNVSVNGAIFAYLSRGLKLEGVKLTGRTSRNYVLGITWSSGVRIRNVIVNGSSASSAVGLWNVYNLSLENALVEGGSVDLMDSRYVSLRNVAISGGGISLLGWEPEDYTHYRMENVTIDGYPVLYIANTRGGEVRGRSVGELIVVNSTGLVIDSVNVTKWGTLIAYSRDLLIENSNLSRGRGYDLFIRNSVGLTIRNCRVGWEIDITGERLEHYATHRISGVENLRGEKIVQVRDVRNGEVRIDNETIRQLILANLTNTSVVFGPSAEIKKIYAYGVSNSTLLSSDGSLISRIYLMSTEGVSLQNISVGLLWIENSTGLRVRNATVGHLDLRDEGSGDGPSVVEDSFLGSLDVYAKNPVVIEGNVIGHLSVGGSRNGSVFITNNVIIPLRGQVVEEGVVLRGSRVVVSSNVISGFKVGLSILECHPSSLIYNNLFNNTENVVFPLYPHDNSPACRWNTTLSRGPNVVGGPFIGGNYWASPLGHGYSETCTDSDNNGICDGSYTINVNNVDYLPLAKPGKLSIPLRGNFGRLRLSGIPPDTWILVNGIFVSDEPRELYLPPGTYRIEVINYHYRNWNTTVVLRPGEAIELRPKLEPLFGNLSVDSIPAGAEVYVNGSLVGRTPTGGVLLSPGTYVVRVVKEGYGERSANVTLGRGEVKRLLFVLRPLPLARLEVASLPPGAGVYINGRYRGKTPAQFQLSPGNYTLELVKDGYERYAVNVTLSPGEFREVLAKLAQRPSVLRVISSPSGASVYVNGGFKGRTPLELELPPGNYTVTLASEGYENLTLYVKLSAGGFREINVTLPRESTEPTPTPSTSTENPSREEETSSPVPSPVRTRGERICGPALFLAPALLPALLRRGH